MAKRKKITLIDKQGVEEVVEAVKKAVRDASQKSVESVSKIEDAFDLLSKKAKKSLQEGFGDSSGVKSLDDISQALEVQRSVVQGLEQDYKKAKAEFDSVNIGTQDAGLVAKRKQASDIFREVRTELTLENQQLEKQEAAYKLISAELANTTQKSVSFVTEMRRIQDTMRNMALNGQEGTAEYEALRKKLDDVALAYNKVSGEQRMMYKYGSLTIPGLMQGLSGVTGTFSAYQGVASMFSKNDKSLLEIQTKIQAAMSITIGLQQAYQATLPHSAFRVGVLNKVTKAWTTAQNSLNTSLGISKGLASAFLTGGVMALVAGIGYLISKYRDWSKEQEFLKKSLESYNNALVSEKANLDYLFDTYKNAEKGTKDYKESKDKITEQLSKYYSGLDAEKLLVENTTEAYNKLAIAIQNTAKEKAMQETYESEAKILLDKSLKGYSGLKEALYNTTLKKEADKLYKEIASHIESTGTIPKELEDKLRGMRTTRMRLLPDRFGNTTEQIVETDEIWRYTRELMDAQQHYRQQVSKAGDAFDFIQNKDQEVAIKSLIEVQKDLRKEAQKLPETTEAEIRAKNIKLDTIDKEIARLNKLGIATKEQAKLGSNIDADIEKTKFNIAKEGVEDRIKLLDLEEAEELKSIRQKYENTETSEEKVKELLDLTSEYYKLKRAEVLKDEEKKNNEKLQKEQEQLEKSLESFETYEVQRQAIVDKYADLRKSATDKHDVGLIDKAEEEDIKALDSKFKPIIEQSAIDITRARVNELIIELNRLRSEISKGGDPKDVQALQDRIDQVLNTLQNKSPFVAFQENLKEAFADGIDFTKLGGAIDEVLPALQNVANDTRALFGDGIGDSLDGFIQGLGGLADLSKSIGSFASGDIMGGVAGLLSAGNKLFGNARKVNAEHREALRLLQMQKREIEHQIALAELREKLESKTSIFGGDKWGQSIRSAEAYAKALEKVGKLTTRDYSNQGRIDSLEKKKDNTRNGFLRSYLSFQIRQLQEEQKSALEKIEVVTGSKKSGWGPWRKRKDVWGSISELKEFDNLFDKSTGEINVRVANSILQHRKLTDEGKMTLQELIDNADVMKDAYNQLADGLRDTFGELGGVIADTFAESAKKGISSFENLEKSAGKMLENLAKEMIYNATIGGIAEDYSKKMVEVRLSGKSDKEMIDAQFDLVAEFIKKSKEQEDKYEDLLQYAKDSAQKEGFEILDSANQDHTRKGMAGMSQDTANELNGRFTALQIVGEKTLTQAELIATQQKNYSAAIQERMGVMRGILTTGVRQLIDIKTFASSLPKIKDGIDRIDKNTKNLIR